MTKAPPADAIGEDSLGSATAAVELIRAVLPSVKPEQKEARTDGSQPLRSMFHSLVGLAEQTAWQLTVPLDDRLLPLGTDSSTEMRWRMLAALRESSLHDLLNEPAEMLNCIVEAAQHQSNSSTRSLARRLLQRLRQLFANRDSEAIDAKALLRLSRACETQTLDLRFAALLEVMASRACSALILCLCLTEAEVRDQLSDPENEEAVWIRYLAHVSNSKQFLIAYNVSIPQSPSLSKFVVLDASLQELRVLNRASRSARNYPLHPDMFGSDLSELCCKRVTPRLALLLRNPVLLVTDQFGGLLNRRVCSPIFWRSQSSGNRCSKS